MVIIDGHNLLWAVRKLSEDRDVMEEFQLCHILGRYFELIRGEGEIIFDGLGPRDKTGFDGIKRIGIVFVGQETDSDTVIEEKIKASANPKKLLVVSSDRRLRAAAAACKASAVKAEVFWEDIQKELSRKRRPKEPPAKRKGITEGETDKWLEIFGIEQ